MLGIYYLTSDRGSEFVNKGIAKIKHSDGQKYPLFSHPHEAMLAHAAGRIGMHAPILLRVARRPAGGRQAE